MYCHSDAIGRAQGSGGRDREGDRVAGFEVIELAGHAPGQIGLCLPRAPRAALGADLIAQLEAAFRS